jgi:hypothetical protein
MTERVAWLIEHAEPTTCNVDDSELLGDYGFHPRELTGIYFGPKCPDGDRSDLLNLLSHGLEHVKVYEMIFDYAAGTADLTARYEVAQTISLEPTQPSGVRLRIVLPLFSESVAVPEGRAEW